MLLSEISTVSMRLVAHLASAHIPLFGLKVVVKYDVTQCELCLGILPIPLFHLDLAGNALHAYARGYSISIRMPLLMEFIGAYILMVCLSMLYMETGLFLYTYRKTC